MAVIFEEDIRESSVEDVAKKMMLAARTAPKARGRDNLVIALVDKDEIIKIAAVMQELPGTPSFTKTSFMRDADNILKAEALFLIGTKIVSLGLDCGLCGFPTCQEKAKYPKQPCAFNTGDLGIALGSAVSIAMDHRIDNRIMYTVGVAAGNGHASSLRLLGEDVAICYGVPLSATGKNVFFDRKPVN